MSFHFRFNANRWLDKSKGDKAVKVDLLPDSKNGKSPSPTKAPSPTKPPASQKLSKGKIQLSEGSGDGQQA